MATLKPLWSIHMRLMLSRAPGTYPVTHCESKVRGEDTSSSGAFVRVLSRNVNELNDFDRDVSAGSHDRRTNTALTP
jgi:hypothetical protein